MAQEKAHQLLSVATVRKVLTAEEIQAQLDAWYEAERSDLDRKAGLMSDHIPLHVRKQECKENLDKEFESLKAQYGL